MAFYISPNLQEIPLTFGHVIWVLRNSNYSTLNFKYEMRFWSLDIKWCVCVWLLCCSALWLACLFLQALSLSPSLSGQPATQDSAMAISSSILFCYLLFSLISNVASSFMYSGNQYLFIIHIYIHVFCSFQCNS